MIWHYGLEVLVHGEWRPRGLGHYCCEDATWLDCERMWRETWKGWNCRMEFRVVKWEVGGKQDAQSVSQDHVGQLAGPRDVPEVVGGGDTSTQDAAVGLHPEVVPGPGDGNHVEVRAAGGRRNGRGRRTREIPAREQPVTDSLFSLHRAGGSEA